MKVKSTKTGNVAELFLKDAKGVQLKLEDGTIKELALSTFKRYWKEVKEVIPEPTKKMEKVKTEKAKGEPKAKKVKAGEPSKFIDFAKSKKELEVKMYISNNLQFAVYINIDGKKKRMLEAYRNKKGEYVVYLNSKFFEDNMVQVYRTMQSTYANMKKMLLSEEEAIELLERIIEICTK